MSHATTPGREGAPGPLDGVRVLDVSQLLPGPYAAQLLADLGADVIKVEPPQGDGARRIRGELFVGTNRNKRGVVLDLKDEAGRTELLRLAAEADVLVEGYRPGVTARLGIGYDDVAALNPGIIYCSISGFGQDGAQVPGHDLNYLAQSGVLSFSGHWGETPRRPGAPMADLGSASFAAVAVLAALRERDRTGRGGHLDVSMTDVMTAWAATRGGPRLERSVDITDHLYPTNDLYRTRDGHQLALGAIEEKFWRAARQVLAQVEPRLDDPRWDTEAGRLEHGDELHALVAGAIAQRDRDEWLRDFAGSDAPATSVRSLADAVSDHLARDTGLVAEQDGQRHVLFPVRRDGHVMGRLRSTAPSLDSDQAPNREEPIRWTSR